MQNMGKMVRSTPPQHGGHAHSNLAPRHQSVGGTGGGGSYHGTNYDGEGRGVHSTHPSPGPAHHGYHQGGGPQHQPFQPSQGRGSSSGSYGSYGQGRAQGQGSYNNKMANQQSSESRLNGEERKVASRESPYESKGSHPSTHQHAPQAPSAQRDHPAKEQRKTYSGAMQLTNLLIRNVFQMLGTRLGSGKVFYWVFAWLSFQFLN